MWGQANISKKSDVPYRTSLFSKLVKLGDTDRVHRDSCRRGSDKYKFKLMSPCSQSASITPFLLGCSSRCMLIDRPDEASVYIDIHLAEQRAGLVDHAEFLTAEAKGHR